MDSFQQSNAVAAIQLLWTIRLQLMIIKLHKRVKTAHQNFPDHKLTYSDALFCPTSSPKPKYSQ